MKTDAPRGDGILGHAGIQSMLCWMGEDLVIYRCARALRQILDKPPYKPPLEVLELKPSDGNIKGRSFKQLLRQHQEDERCSVYHKNFNPMVFAFQNFDISGRWRDVEYDTCVRGELDERITCKGVGKTRPFDTVGRVARNSRRSPSSNKFW